VESVLGSSQHVLCDGFFHAKHGEARAVQPKILDVHERTVSSIRKSENGSCHHFLVAQFYQQASWHLEYDGGRMHRCVCIKKVKALFTAHFGKQMARFQIIRRIFNHRRLIIDEVCPPCRIVAGKISNVAYTFFR